MAGCRSAEVKFSGLVRSSAMTYDRGSAGPLGDGLPAAGAMAQLVAHLLCKQGVRGSSPLGSTYFPLSNTLSALLWRSGSDTCSSKLQQLAISSVCSSGSCLTIGFR